MWGEFCRTYSSLEEKRRNDGLIKDEGEIMDLLAKAFNKFTELEITHPSERDDFIDGIHECQQVLMNRVLRRDYPNGYPSYNKESE